MDNTLKIILIVIGSIIGLYVLLALIYFSILLFKKINLKRKTNKIEKQKDKILNQIEETNTIEKVDNKQKLKSNTKKIITINKNLIIKILLITFYTLSALLILADIILINIPLINMLIIPLEITLVILSIIFLLIANAIVKTARYNKLINIIQNQNRDK